MSPKHQFKTKINMDELLNQYEKFFQKPKEEQLEEPIRNNEKIESLENLEFLPLAREENSLITLNNKNNPKISIFDAYAFNEVMRRYENSIVQLTKQEIQLKENSDVAGKYENEIGKIKNGYEQKIAELELSVENEGNLREILDQVNFILDEKDEKIAEFKTINDERKSELDKMKKELEEKQLTIKNMESQLYTVLFKINEASTLV